MKRGYLLYSLLVACAAIGQSALADQVTLFGVAVKDAERNALRQALKIAGVPATPPRR